jgi:hypothetical protein
VSEPIAAMLLWDSWNPRCEPPWSSDELERKVRNAYAYGVNTPGIAAPEVEFAAVPFVEDAHTEKELHPYEKLNKDHAFVIAGGGAHILWETSDQHDKGTVEHLDIGAFKLKFAPIKMKVGKTETSIASQWLEWKGRRAYDGIVFSPGQDKEVRLVLTVAGRRILISGVDSHIPRPLLAHLIDLSICFLNTPGLMSAGEMNVVALVARILCASRTKAI